MRSLHGWLTCILAAAGVLILVIGFAADLSDKAGRLLVSIGFDCALFAIIGAIYPRSNRQLKDQTTEFARFSGLAILTFAAVSALVFIAFGAPSPVGDEVFSTALTIGLAAALIAPILAKNFILKIRAK